MMERIRGHIDLVWKNPLRNDGPRGISGVGTVFKINTDGSGFLTLHYFPATSVLALTVTERCRIPVCSYQIILSMERHPQAAVQAMGHCSVFSSCPNWQSLLRAMMWF